MTKSTSNKDTGDAFEDTADVAFKVKRSTIYAHKFILKAQEPDLAELIDTFTRKEPFPKEDVDAVQNYAFVSVWYEC
jgi:hypothetical protein